MSKLVVLNLGAGNLNSGFPHITAQLRADNGGFEQFIGSLPPNPKLATLNYNWQTLYQALHQRFDVARRRLFEVEAQGLTNISVREFQELCQEIEIKFNLWLDSPSFSPIDRKLRTKLTPNDEIQIIMETGDLILHRFPWHLWHFLEDYQQAEIGISTPEYSQINITKKSRNKLRILTILGHSEGINIEADRDLIKQIKNAEITFLVEPKSAEFHQQLWDKEGWDILFFAGHSHTENHQGIIFINPQESLTISELKMGLNEAIKQGLNLAIFNSCDGIGLAQELSKLNIPQVIVMRQGVPDLIAQEFLKNFLSALQQNKSVFCALREARERLQAWDKDFPGGSWLPMICQNPIISPRLTLKPPKVNKVVIYHCQTVRSVLTANRVQGIQYCKGWEDFKGMGIAVITAYSSWDDQYHVYLNDNFSQFQLLVNQAERIVGFNSQKFHDRLCLVNDLKVITTYDLYLEIRKAVGFSTEEKIITGYDLESIAQVNLNYGKTGFGSFPSQDWQKNLQGKVIDYSLKHLIIIKKIYEQRNNLIDPINRTTLTLED
jgi:CHAT domain